MGLAQMGYSTDSTDPDEFNAATIFYSAIGAIITGVLVRLLVQHRATSWTPVMREPPLALPLRPWGIESSKI
jgi:hypothetical protein